MKKHALATSSFLTHNKKTSTNQQVKIGKAVNTWHFFFLRNSTQSSYGKHLEEDLVINTDTFPGIYKVKVLLYINT